MAKFFISYRRVDTGQLVGRMAEKLAGYFGRDAVYVDVDRVPVGQEFPAHIQKFLSDCDAVLVVIGRQWISELENRPEAGEDYVRIELETALRLAIPVLPVLVDQTPMPRPDELPPSIAQLSFRNAFQLDAGREFNTGLGRLIQFLDSIRISKVLDNRRVGDYQLIRVCCNTVMAFLRREHEQNPVWPYMVEFMIHGTRDFGSIGHEAVTLYLYRVVTDSTSLVEMHFLLTPWARDVSFQHTLLGWLMDRLQRNPVLPVDPDLQPPLPPGLTLRVFPSMEDPRPIWASVADRLYEISVPYILRATY